MPHLIVIEDNPGDLLLIRDAVTRASSSIEMTTFNDGAQALAELCGPDSTLTPDGILLDLRLKLSDGLDVLRQIRFTPRLADIPVVIFTSSKASIDQQRSKVLGAARFVPKPLKVDEYFGVISDVVHQMFGDTPSPCSLAGRT